MASKIQDYALMSDREAAALVDRNGSIDWLCWPDFSSDACLASLLGSPENGYWRISPLEGEWSSSRRYRDHTLILETTFHHSTGAVRLIDLEEINPHLIPALLRCAFASAVRLDLPWSLPEEEKVKSMAADHERIQERIDSQLTWLEARKSAWSWPEFPIQQIRPCDYWRNSQRDYAAETAEYHSVKLGVDYQRAALWLKQARPIFPST
jgi:hypothetical protein